MNFVTAIATAISLIIQRRRADRLRRINASRQHEQWLRATSATFAAEVERKDRLLGLRRRKLTAAVNPG